MKLRLFWIMLAGFALAIVWSVAGMLSFIALVVTGIWQPVPLPENIKQTQTTYVTPLASYYTANGDSWSGVEQRLQKPPFTGIDGVVSYTITDENDRVVASNNKALALGQQ